MFGEVGSGFLFVPLEFQLHASHRFLICQCLELPECGRIAAAVMESAQ